MRKLSIIFMVTGAVLFVVSVGTTIHNLSSIYDMAGECIEKSCGAKVDTELKGLQRSVDSARVGLIVGLAMGVTGVILFRRSEEQVSKSQHRKDKLVY